ncbi:MAG: ligase-associated DNA damage response endonuclease PdeM [Candidatus Sumerlaeia bacterium]|nr:ligase-associated DNA damage response endonuclease PdeM [Candidatus Sumerlaeia bacterium]
MILPSEAAVSMEPRPADTSIECAGESMLAMGCRALFRPATGTLLIADPHFGKAASLQAAGVPVPEATIAEPLARLTAALRSTGARELVILGDFFHDRHSRSPETLRRLAEWRAAHAVLRILLVRGNHDRHAGDPPGDLRIECAAEQVEAPPFAYGHYPDRAARGYLLAGHLHPAIRLKRRGETALRGPCFWFRQNSAVLPAFGELTGKADIAPSAGDRVVLAVGGVAVPLPG